jgi:hypothetical protein
VSQREIKDGDLQENLQQVFSSHQQQLREVVEESARFLREAVLSARQLHQQTVRNPSDHVQAEGANADAGHLKPLTEGFIGQAQRRAQEMFDEIGRASTEARSGVNIPRATGPSLEKPSGIALEDPVAATTLLMKQATQHLNAAMESVIQGMKGHLAATVGANKLGDVGDAGKNRSSELLNHH